MSVQGGGTPECWAQHTSDGANKGNSVAFTVAAPSRAVLGREKKWGR
jgi:hypothetical protein